MVGRGKAEMVILICYVSAFNIRVFSQSGSHRVCLNPVASNLGLALAVYPSSWMLTVEVVLYAFESSREYFYNLHGSTAPGISC